MMAGKRLPANPPKPVENKVPLDGFAGQIALLLQALGIEECDPIVISQLSAFVTRETTEILEDASKFAQHAGREEVELDDVKMAVEADDLTESLSNPPVEEIVEMAQMYNSQPLPQLDLRPERPRPIDLLPQNVTSEEQEDNQYSHLNPDPAVPKFLFGEELPPPEFARRLKMRVQMEDSDFDSDDDKDESSEDEPIRMVPLPFVFRNAPLEARRGDAVSDEEQSNEESEEEEEGEEEEEEEGDENDDENEESEEELANGSQFKGAIRNGRHSGSYSVKGPSEEELLFEKVAADGGLEKLKALNRGMSEISNSLKDGSLRVSSLCTQLIGEKSPRRFSSKWFRGYSSPKKKLKAVTSNGRRSLFGPSAEEDDDDRSSVDESEVEEEEESDGDGVKEDESDGTVEEEDEEEDEGEEGDLEEQGEGEEALDVGQEGYGYEMEGDQGEEEEDEEEEVEEGEEFEEAEEEADDWEGPEAVKGVDQEDDSNISGSQVSDEDDE